MTANNKYVRQYIREHYKTFKVDLKIEEMDELNSILRKHNLTKAEFLRQAIKNIKKAK